MSFVDPKEWAWCMKEFGEIDFGDARLNARFRKTAGLLSSSPSSPINKSSGNWANAKGAYRMFDNDRIDSETIIGEHRKKTVERAVREGQRVLVIQDTTYLNYDRHKATTGLGNIGKCHGKNPQGLIMHTALAVSTAGLPLGIIDQDIRARPPKSREKKTDPKRVPIAKKETERWVRFLVAMKQHFLESPVRPVCLADRESDIFEFLQAGDVQQIDYVIRAAWDRKVTQNLEDGGYGYLWDKLESTASSGQFELDVICPKSGEVRRALLEVRFCEVEICPPIRARLSRQRRDGADRWSPIKTNAILVREIGAPSPNEALEWMLLTRLPVNSLEEALEKISWYRLRWHIEEFHKVLKSGCGAEDCRLSSANKLKRFLTLLSIIAVRLYWLTHLSRHKPESPCTEALEDHEWKALHFKMTGTPDVPIEPPTLRQATRWIAQLGGFLARKGDGDPGIVTLWRGWQRLQDIADAWLLFNRRTATCG